MIEDRTRTHVAFFNGNEIVVLDGWRRVQQGCMPTNCTPVAFIEGGIVVAAEGVYAPDPVSWITKCDPYPTGSQRRYINSVELQTGIPVARWFDDVSRDMVGGRTAEAACAEEAAPVPLHVERVNLPTCGVSGAHSFWDPGESMNLAGSNGDRHLEGPAMRVLVEQEKAAAVARGMAAIESRERHTQRVFTSIRVRWEFDDDARTLTFYDATK